MTHVIATRSRYSTKESNAPSKYYLVACADDTTSVDESNETNNCKASANRVLVARPDLIESALVDPPPSAAPGGSFQVTDTVQNQAAMGAWSSTTRYYISLDASHRNGDIRLTGTRSAPALAPGASSPGTATVTIPTTVPLASYYLLACADDKTDVTESNETNNSRASINPVAIGP